MCLVELSTDVGLSSLVKYEHVSSYLTKCELSPSAMSGFADMRSVMNEYVNASGGVVLSDRLSILCDAPGVLKMKKEANKKQRLRTKTTKSLCNQTSVLNDMPLHEIASKTLAFCKQTWIKLKPIVMSRCVVTGKGEKRKKKKPLTIEQRKQLAGLFLTVHYMSVCVERNCNILSLRLGDGVGWLNKEVCVSAQHKVSCVQQFSSFDSTPLTKTYLRDHVHFIRGTLCNHHGLAPPVVDTRDTDHMHAFVSLTSSSWAAYLRSRDLQGRGRYVRHFFAIHT